MVAAHTYTHTHTMIVTTDCYAIFRASQFTLHLPLSILIPKNTLHTSQDTPILLSLRKDCISVYFMHQCGK